jgi:bifunctional ADP-heptose synthase (sugar kinase/adenylyltransferase)
MKHKIAVVGDAFIDRYFVGTSTRISPEAPIPVVNIHTVFDRPGGAANVAENVRSLGGDVDLLANTVRPIKNRLMIEDIQIARWDMNDVCTPYGPIVDNNYKAVIISDYGKGSITERIIQAVAEMNVPVFIDTKRTPNLFNGIKYRTFFPNNKEYHQFREYMLEYQVVLKQGAAGLDYMVCGTIIHHEQALARRVRSVNGAGDTVIAAYVVALMYGHLEPLQFASAAAACAVETPYTTAPDFGATVTRWKESYASTKH